MANVEKIEAFNIAKKKKLRVAAYARVSTTNEEQLLSLANQKQHYKQAIENNPDYEFAGLYFDEGISGTKIKKRDGLIKLLEDCEKGKIDRVITKSISRFSRNLTDCLEMVRRLRELNISILFEKENIDTGHMDSELMLTILSSIAESESRSLSENVKWGVIKRFEENEFVISVPPFGYKRNGNDFAIDEKEAAVIKRIFDLATNGYGSYRIARILDEEGVKPRVSKKWCPGSVYRILLNEKYTGDVIYQKYYNDENYILRINNDVKNKYYVKDHHPAIISHETFEIANREIKRRAKDRKIDSSISKCRYTFSGKIQCGNCGANYVRTSYKTRDHTRIGWGCKKHIDSKDNCHMKQIYEEDIKFAFIKVLNKLKFSKSKLLIPFIDSLRKESKMDNSSLIQDIEKEIDDNIKKQYELNELYSLETIEESFYQTEKAKLNNELSALTCRKEQILSKNSSLKQHLKEARKLLNLINKNNIKNFEDDDFLEVVDFIKVNERNVFEFNLKCGLKLKEGVNDYE